MKFGVTRKTLMLTAGIVWVLAGVNILHIGIDCWAVSPYSFTLKLLGALAVFAGFHFGVFSKMYRKHHKRISSKSESNCPMSFFDKKGWIIMAFMILLGIVIRHFSLMPIWFIAIFYTGLSSVLIVTGLRFLFTANTAH